MTGSCYLTPTVSKLTDALVKPGADAEIVMRPAAALARMMAKHSPS